MFIRNNWYVAAWPHELTSDRPVARTLLGNPESTLRFKSAWEALPRKQRPLLVYNWEATVFPRWLPLRARARFAANCVRFGARTIADRYRVATRAA